MVLVRCGNRAGAPDRGLAHRQPNKALYSAMSEKHLIEASTEPKRQTAGRSGARAAACGLDSARSGDRAFAYIQPRRLA